MTSKTGIRSVAAHIRELLPVDLLKANGAVLYSSSETCIKKGKYYLMGTNPGGDPAAKVQEANTVGASIDALESQDKNAYLDENWIDASDDKDKEGASLVQRRIQDLAAEILRTKLESVCASNLLFGRSRRINTDYLSSKSFWMHADYCWPVHLHIISLIDPDLLVVFGNGAASPYAFIRWRYGCSAGDEVSEDSGYSNWRIKLLRDVPIWGRARTVIGVPHFTYFDPMKEGIRRKLTEWVNEALS